ncbi:MAG: hypothetical protein IT379_00520 [Deltaproteobacteria bacterium]|nr:hypothetical protein [Deltaproteobacteria bacterium]
MDPVGPIPPPPPRAVPRGAVGWNASLGLLLGAVFGGVGVFVPALLLVIGGPPWHDLILDMRAKRTTATPTVVSGTGSSVNDVQVMRISFRYRAEDGRTHQAASTTASRDLIERGRGHGELDIEYDPDEPSRARIAGTRISVIPPVAYLPALLGVVGLVVLARSAASALRTRRIYRRGVAVAGEVLRHDATASSENDQSVIDMRYRFRGPHGDVEGGWKTVRPAPVGAALWILHLPGRPDQNVPAMGWPTAPATPTATTMKQTPPTPGAPKIYS